MYPALANIAANHWCWFWISVNLENNPKNIEWTFEIYFLPPHCLFIQGTRGKLKLTEDIMLCMPAQHIWDAGWMDMRIYTNLCRTSSQHFKKKQYFPYPSIRLMVQMITNETEMINSPRSFKMKFYKMITTVKSWKIFYLTPLIFYFQKIKAIEYCNLEFHGKSVRIM